MTQLKIINELTLSEIKPMVHFANKLSAAASQKWGPRTIGDCQLIYVISGQAHLKLGRNNYLLNAGEIVFYGSESPHMLVASSNNPFTFMSIHFDWNTEKDEPIHPIHKIKNCSIHDLNNINIQEYKLRVNDYLEIEMPHHIVLPYAENLFNQIVREYRFEEPGYLFSLRGLFIQLVVLIVRNVLNEGHSLSERRKVAPALFAIRQHAEKNWSIKELADLCGYHPTYFSNMFKEVIGYSPKQFLILERIRKAKQYLLEDKTIEEVAYKLGYSSVHYFCKNFKSITGLTPTEYKLQSIEL